MDTREIFEFIKPQTHAVLATVDEGNRPEAALVEIAVSETLEILFDTISTTRKCENLRKNPNIALVIGHRGAQTLQYEGVADEPKGSDLLMLKKCYFAACPAGESREGWPGLTYFRVKPRWIRLSNYYRPRSVREMTFS